MLIENYQDLINAVIKRAYDDLYELYMAYYSADIQHREKDACDIEYDIRHLEGWFHDAVQEWTDVSGDYLVRRCRDQVTEEIESNVRRKSYCKRVFRRIDSGKGTRAEGG